jgi:YbbR domain-containing protein
MFFANEQSGESGQLSLSFKRLARKAFLEDWPMKLVALVITLALWFGVNFLRTPTTETYTDIPLNLRAPGNMDVTYSDFQKVTIRVSGDSAKLDALNKNSLTLTRDLTDVGPGQSTVELTTDNVAIVLPMGVKLVEIQPSRIPVRIETVEEKDIAVQASIEGRPAEGYEVYYSNPVPQKVRVRGPSSYIKSLEFVSTEKINIENKTGDFVAKQVPVSLLNPKAALLDSVVVDVSFRIDEKRIERSFGVPVKDDPAGRSVYVLLYGPQSLIEKIKPADLKAAIEKTDSGEDSANTILPTELQDKVEIRRQEIRGRKTGR